MMVVFVSTSHEAPRPPCTFILLVFASCPPRTCRRYDVHCDSSPVRRRLGRSVTWTSQQTYCRTRTSRVRSCSKRYLRMEWSIVAGDKTSGNHRRRRLRWRRRFLRACAAASLGNDERPVSCNWWLWYWQSFCPPSFIWLIGIVRLFALIGPIVY